TGVISRHLERIGRTTGEADQYRGGRFLPHVGAVVVISGLRYLFGLGCRGYEQPKGLGVACIDRLGAGMGRALKLLALGVDDLQDGGLGQHTAFAGAGVDAGYGLLGRIAEHAVTGRSPQTGGDGNLAWGLPGTGRGDLGGAVGLVLDASPLDVHRTEDGL